MSEDVIYPLLQAIPILYLVLQIAGLFVLKGRLRTVARLCALVMGGLILLVIFATVVGGSNIAPIWIVFALPVLTLTLVVVWTLHVVVRPANRV
jgi:uncharacterized membrane protein YobD (UPF0266 family)